MDNKEILAELMMLLPHWNYRIVRPVKQLLDGDVSLEMYYCLQMLRWGGEMTMGDFAHRMRMPKHQMSKMANRLFEQQLIERIYDPADRRVVKVKATAKAQAYIDGFLEENTQALQALLEKMGPEEQDRFGAAVDDLFQLFTELPL